MLLRLEGSGPLSLRVFRALRQAILAGRLPPRGKLPSSRALAAELGVSRNTVLLAYDQLLGEGYATGRRGSGTYANAELPVATGRDPSPATSGSPTPRLSRFARRLMLRREPRSPVRPARRARLPYDFRYGRPAFGDLPHEIWNRCLARAARRASRRDLDYGPPGGVAELRAAIAEYLGRARAVACAPDQVLVVGGSQQGLDLAARVLIEPGDRVLLEEPHYAGARRVFAAAGARLVGAAVDGDGLRPEGLPRGAVRLAYVTPSHQFPTGAVLSLARRLALLDWAKRAGATLIEDDYDGEFRYAGRPLESLQGLDRHGRVLYLGTFSKLLFPALRLGYLVLPRNLLEPFLAAKSLTDTGSPSLEQRALADFLRDGHFGRHVRRSRARNAERRGALLEALTEHFGERGEVTGADAGVHLLLWLRDVAAARTPALIAAAADAGVGVYPVSPFYLRPPLRAGFLLGYAGLTPTEIRRGIRLLAEAVL